MNPGVYPGIPAAEYHAMRDIVSKSHLDRIARSPMHYQHYMTEPFKQTDAMLVGSALHCLVLEPHLFDAEYIAIPEDAPTKPNIRQINAKNPSAETVQAIRYWDQLRGSGKVILTAEQLRRVQGMAAAVSAHPLASSVLVGQRELTIVFDEPATGVRCKARLDDWNQELRIIADLKSTVDASPSALARSCDNYRYHVQAALYLTAAMCAGLAPDLFVFVAVESEPPHAVTVFELDKPAILKGQSLYERDLRTLKQCRASGHWPSYSSDPITLSLPAWSKAA